MASAAYPAGYTGTVLQLFRIDLKVSRIHHTGFLWYSSIHPVPVRVVANTVSGANAFR